MMNTTKKNTSIPINMLGILASLYVIIFGLYSYFMANKEGKIPFQDLVQTSSEQLKKISVKKHNDNKENLIFLGENNLTFIYGSWDINYEILKNSVKKNDTIMFWLEPADDLSPIIKLIMPKKNPKIYQIMIDKRIIASYPERAKELSHFSDKAHYFLILCLVGGIILIFSIWGLTIKKWGKK